MAFSPDGKTLAATGNVTTGPSSTAIVELWSVSTCSLVASYGVEDQFFNSIAFSPDGTQVAVVGSTQGLASIVFLSASTGKQITTINTHADGLNSVAFSPDGSQVVVGGANDLGGLVQTWSVASGALNRTFATSADKSIYSVTFSPDGKTLADCGSASAGGLVETWDIASGNQLATFSGPQQVFLSVAFSRGDLLLAVGGYNLPRGSGGVLEILSATVGSVEATFKTGATQVNTVAFNTGGNTLAAGGIGQSGLLEQWNVTTSDQVTSYSTGLVQKTSTTAFTIDGKTVANTFLTSNEWGILGLWDATSGILVDSINVGQLQVNAIAFSPDGSTLALSGTDFYSNGFLEFLDVGTHQIIYSTSYPDTVFTSIAYSSDGNSVAICGYVFDSISLARSSLLQILDVQNYGIVSSLPAMANEFFNAVAFWPGGTRVAVGGGVVGNQGQAAGGIVGIWDTATDKWTNTFPTATSLVEAVTFLPGSLRLAVGGVAGSTGTSLEVWDITSDQLLSVPTLAPNTD